MDDLLGRLLPLKNGDPAEGMAVSEWCPLVDITEDDKEFLIKAELPELKKEEVKVTVENGRLSLTGERKLEKEEKGRKYHRIERSYGSFLRTFALPEGVSPEKVTADFADGVLKIHLPKNETAPSKSVEVPVNSVEVK